MAGVDEIRAGIATANEKCNSSIAALQQAAQALEEARQILSQVTSGSNQPEVTQANGLLANAGQGISDTQGTIQQAISSAEQYSARL
ncbi:MAG TPA: hypothetical protein VJT49_05700 [Amycolatopsis sp.]|uniref:hypothetical protein n=1 Tax=Amycolatopsis sp. TaxID=37632 RepID=UPI002B4A8F94|nr:hypothetical protein [Amycolatopsis sp.]HKS44600.1 hypothetical protein [Amycolatopsis sp.]